MRFEKTNLLLEGNKKIHYNKDYIEEYKHWLNTFLKDMDFMKNIDFASRVMFSTEIKSNNTIEGIYDDIEYIEEVIAKNKDDVKRIINLYQGYKYILTHESINKESLKELYAILSDSLLTKYDLQCMGEYYRNDIVYIFSTNNFDNPYLGIEPNKINYYMDILFDYINNFKVESEIDNFLKSQIMHFYFVYIHPYFDVNGRCSRTLSMWYLLNNKLYPYLIFNRAISFKRNKYINRIITTRNHGDITLFLEYMLKGVHNELEKEYILYNLNSNLNYNLTKEELQILKYMLSMNSNVTIKDLVTTYNRFNKHQRLDTLYYNKIKELIDKNIIVLLQETKTNLIDNNKNYFIGINPDLLTIDYSNFTYLEPKKYIKK